MNTTLIAAGALMGLGSSPHCVAMCAAPCAALVRSCGSAAPGRALLAWHLGRSAAYTAAGALAAASVGLVSGLASTSALLQPLWVMAQAAVLVVGLGLLASGRMPAWIDGASQSIARRWQPVSGRISLPGSGPRRALLGGLAWVALPCGVLYAALAISALAASPLEGAAVMLAFGLGSGTGLAIAPALWQRFARLRNAGALRLAGGVLALGSAWALWHGVGGVVSAWCGAVS